MKRPKRLWSKQFMQFPWSWQNMKGKQFYILTLYSLCKINYEFEVSIHTRMDTKILITHFYQVRPFSDCQNSKIDDWMGFLLIRPSLYPGYLPIRIESKGISEKCSWNLLFGSVQSTSRIIGTISHTVWLIRYEKCKDGDPVLFRWFESICSDT